jgi:peptidoglycan/LPS O-acetylase OafA/YrhL
MNGHSVYLDSLRGLAALSVVLSHFVGAYSLTPSLGWLEESPFHIFYDGFAAVSLFFVLSGFVLSRRYFEEEIEFRPIAYIVARFFRIFPPFLVILLASAGLATLSVWFPPSTPSASKWLESFWSGNLTLANLLDQARFIQPAAGLPVYVPQAWTLGFELLLSSLVPFMAVLLRKGWAWLGLFLILLLVYFNASDFLIQFAMGVVLAFGLSRVRKLWSTVGRGSRIGIFGLGIVLYTFRFTLPLYLEHILGHPVPIVGTNRFIWFATGLGSTILVGSLLCSRRFQSVLEFPPLRFLGRVSYSIYLVHFAILITCVPWAISIGTHLGLDSTVNLALGVFVLVGFTIAISAFTFRYIEAPSVALGKAVLFGWDKVWTSIARLRRHD